MNDRPGAIAVRGEYEGRQGSARSCAPYQRGEVETSRTEQGHLSPDVVVHPQGGLLIADFGVDWRHTKPSLSRDPTLRKWLSDMITIVRVNPTTRISITGYSDCVGRERDNSVLRRGRARRVCQLLQRLAGRDWSVLRRNVSFEAAPTGEYLTDNATAAGRATNRAVRIQHVRWVGFKPEDIAVQRRVPDTIERICRRGLELIQRQDLFGTRITVYQQQRIRCFLSRLCQAGFDDRYLTGQGVLDYTNRLYPQPYYASAKQWLLPDFAVRAGGPRSDQDIWETLVRIDYDIFQGRHTINRYYYTHGAATPIGIQRLRDWVATQEDNRNSIYWCYGKHGP